MKLTDKRFWIAWMTLFILIVVWCVIGGGDKEPELHDTVVILPLLSTLLCHKVSSKVAYGNLIVMIAFNAMLCLLAILNYVYRIGPKGWFVAVILLELSIIQAIALLLFIVIHLIKGKGQ